MLVFLSIVAILIIAGLSIYAVLLLTKVKQVQARALANEREKAAQRDEQIRYVVESIQVIAGNVIQEDLNLSEATIRCKVLLDNLMLSDEQRAPYAVIDEVFAQVMNFSTHDARKALTKQERVKQDLARDDIEQKYASSLKVCFAALQKFEMPQ